MHYCWKASLNIIVTGLHIVISCVYLLLLHDIMVLRSSHCVSIATSFAKYHEFLVKENLNGSALLLPVNMVLRFKVLWDTGKCFSLWFWIHKAPGRWVQKLFFLELNGGQTMKLITRLCKGKVTTMVFFFINLWLMVSLTV